MSYEAQFDEATKAGKAEPVSVLIMQWKDPGDRVVGVFQGAELMPDSEFDTDVNRYLILTDQGLTSVILGASADKEVLPKLHKGDLVSITFGGQKPIKGGKKVNLFDVRRVSASAAKPKG